MAYIIYYVCIIVWYSLWNMRKLSHNIALVLCFVKITAKLTNTSPNLETDPDRLVKLILRDVTSKLVFFRGS